MNDSHQSTWLLSLLYRLLKRALKAKLLIFSLAFIVSANSYAGRACEDQALDANGLMKGMELALKTRNALDASGAQVALIARVGQDLSKYHVRYSHMGIVWRDHPEERWLVVHELNDCGTANSQLYNEGLGNFFMDSPFAYETLIVFQDAVFQKKLVGLLNSDMPKKLHTSHYNMLAFPFSTIYQNSNQWVLELLATASATDVQIENRTQAQAWLMMAAYRPSTLDIPAMTRLGARMFRANVAFDDHPFDRRMAGQIDTITVDSVVNFMEQRHTVSSQQVLTYP